MIYRVVVDGVDYLDFNDSQLVLLDPKLELEINTAGSLEFTMPPHHKYYDDIHILISTVEVYEDEQLIWYGRPAEITIDFYKQKRIYCEGPLSFFNDTIQWSSEVNAYSLVTFFNDVIKMHNSQQPNRNRQFSVGHVTIDDEFVYRKINYESTYNVLKGMCLDTVDGYFFFRRENGVNYIDWVKDIPYICNQTIEFGINLLDYSSDLDMTEYSTCMIPLGSTQSETNEPLTIASVNGGSPTIESEAVSLYGYIYHVQTWSDINDAGELMKEGQRALEVTQFNSLVIECSAADLHSLNKDLEIFMLGQNVHCVSNPHLIDRDFPISKMSIRLDSAAKTITLGIIKRKTLTRIYKNDNQTTTEESTDYTPYESGGYDPFYYDDDQPWELIPPAEDGGTPTMIKAPTRIKVTKPPNKDTYKIGASIDYRGISVSIYTGEQIWTNPPRYLDGKVPYAELTFPTKNMPSTVASKMNVTVIWKYKGKEFKDSCTLNVDKDEAGRGIEGTGDWQFINNQSDEANYVKVPKGVHWIGVMLPNGDEMAVAVSIAGSIDAEYYGMTNGHYTDGPGHWANAGSVQKDGTMIYYNHCHWHAPKPTPQTEYTIADANTDAAAIKAGIKYILGIDVDI